jgi:hypothetical protein
MIESYRFGKMRIRGTVYDNDLIILPDGRILDTWWRRAGHILSASDLAELMEAKPEIIVAGSGASGLMKPTEGLRKELAKSGVKLIVEPTAKALTTFNKLYSDGAQVAGCFHLTC